MDAEFTNYDAEIRIPTTQYGFVSVHVSGDFDEIKSANDELHRIFNGGEGISETDFNAFLDKYLEGDLKGGLEVYEKMNKEQQTIIQAIKRSKKRIAYNKE